MRARPSPFDSSRPAPFIKRSSYCRGQAAFNRAVCGDRQGRDGGTPARSPCMFRGTIAGGTDPITTSWMRSKERMPMTRTFVMAMLIAAAAADARAQTQPPPANLGFVNVNFGGQPSSRDVGVATTFPIYGENANLTTTQENG